MSGCIKKIEEIYIYNEEENIESQYGRRMKMKIALCFYSKVVVDCLPGAYQNKQDNVLVATHIPL